MQPSPEMQSFISACELRHATYLQDTGDTLKMRLGRKDLTLVAQRTGLNTIRVAHELVNADGQIVYDPEVIFFTGYEKWIAMEISQPSTLATEIGRRGTRQKYVELNSTETAVKEYQVSRQKDLATFVKSWVRALRNRGWHENSTNALFRQASFAVDTEDEDSEVERSIEDIAEADRRDGITTTLEYRGRSVTFGKPQSPARDPEEQSFVDRVGDFLDEAGLLELDENGERTHRLTEDATVKLSNFKR